MSIKAFLDPMPVVRIRNVFAIPSEQEINFVNSGTNIRSQDTPAHI
jgi:hypothetical protein